MKDSNKKRRQSNGSDIGASAISVVLKFKKKKRKGRLVLMSDRFAAEFKGHEEVTATFHELMLYWWWVLEFDGGIW